MFRGLGFAVRVRVVQLGICVDALSSTVGTVGGCWEGLSYPPWRPDQRHEGREAGAQTVQEAEQTVIAACVRVTALRGTARPSLPGLVTTYGRRHG